MTTELLVKRLEPLRRYSLIAGAIGAALCVVAYFLTPLGFFTAYLVAFMFFTGVTLGALSQSLLHHCSGGDWGRMIRRVSESAYLNLPLMALLFLPLPLGLPYLYPWARPDEVDASAKLQWKAPYLNVTGYCARAALYFALWYGVAYLVSRMTIRDDVDNAESPSRKLQVVSAAGLLFYGLGMTFAAIDWAMSLTPEWYSSMYGVIIVAGQAVSGFSFAIICLHWLKPYMPWSETVTDNRMHDLGNLLLASVCLWTYVAFMQYLIIWSANLPEETTHYWVRGRQGWQVVVIFLIGFHFVVPFMLLLAKQTKRNSVNLAKVAGLLLIMRVVDLYWLIVPATYPEGFTLLWQLPITLAAVGGAWMYFFALRLPRRAAMPVAFHANATAAHAQAHVAGASANQHP